MKRIKGFSLVELMIAMTLGLLIVGMVLAAYMSGASSRRALTQTSLVIENGRYAVSVMSNEIKMAGSFGNLDLISATLTSAPSVCPTISVAAIESWIDVPIYGFDNVGASGGAASTVLNGCLETGETVKAGTDVLIIRRANTEVTDSGSLVNNAYYLQTTASQSQVNTGSGTFTLKKKDGSTDADIRHFEQMIFYVSGVNDQLKRIRLTDGSFSTEPIADNIDAFEIEYGIDSSDDGAANSFTATPSDVDAWQNVVTVRAGLLVRSENSASGHTDSRIYKVADETLSAFNDNFKRDVFSLNIRANNISLRRL